jgi:hypothetical protein
MARYRRRKFFKKRGVVEFEKRINGIDRKRIIGIAIDISKSFHKVMLVNFEGEVLVAPFVIDVYWGGYEKLNEAVMKTAKTVGASKTFFMMEPTNKYHEAIMNQLIEDFGMGNVRLINPLIAARNREQQTFIGLKSDDIDLGSIADLLLRGEGYDAKPHKGIYLIFKEDTYWAEGREKTKTQIKNRIKARAEQIYPGITAKDEDRGIKPLFKDFWQKSTPRAFLLSGLTVREIRGLSVEELEERLALTKKRVTKKEVEKIKTFMEKVIPPRDERIREDIYLLQKDLALLELLEEQESEIKDRMRKSFKETSEYGVAANQIGGAGDLLLAEYFGVLGGYERYSNSRECYKKSGLCPRKTQSGPYDKKGKITRYGNSTLRHIGAKLGQSVYKYDPYFRAYGDYQMEVKGKGKKGRNIVLFNKLNRILFAMYRDKTPYKPSFERIEYWRLCVRKQRRVPGSKRGDASLKRALGTPSIGIIP